MLDRNFQLDRFSEPLLQLLDSLQTRLEDLADAYQATARQFDCSLTGIDRVKLEAQLTEIDRQMSEIEREIRALI